MARHDHAVWRLPFVYDKWHVRAHFRPLYLPEILRLTEGGPRLFLDLKGGHPRLPVAVLEALRAHNAVDRAAVCGQYWRPLDELHALEPALDLYYSLGRAEHVAAFAGRCGSGLRAAGVSIGQWLVTPELVDELQQASLNVFAWTVNEPRAASQLAAWGVDGVISDRLDLLASLP